MGVHRPPASPPPPPPVPPPAPLPGLASEMAQRVLAFDWSRTSLGPLQDWPPMLLPTLQIGLETALPMCMLWGDDYLQIYNDAFAALAADRHPAALGARVQDSWPELWEFLQQVLPPARQGKPQALRGQRFRLRRHGAWECAWFDFSFTPIRLPDGTVGGVLAGVVEVTAQYRAEQARRDASIALHDSEAQLGAIFSQMAVGIAQADAGANFRMVNDALCAMLGYSREELLQRCILDITHPDDRARNLELYQRLFATGTPFSLLKRYIRPDDSLVWAEVHLSLVRDAQGAPRSATAVVLDVTARHEAERRQARLMDELNHRVKNTLATVQAMAHQTLRSSGEDPPRFSAAFMARLRALASAHDLLIRQAWDGAELGQVATTALASWLGPRLGIETGPAVRLEARQAQTLVLALHELATNAVKHGALSGAAGQVLLRWHRRGGLICLVWQETGGPPLDGPPRRRGFGTRLLQHALARDLGEGGNVSIDFLPEGLRADIVFPAAAGGGARADRRSEAAAKSAAKSAPGPQPGPPPAG